FDVDHRVVGDDPTLDRFASTRFDRGRIVARNRTADDLPFELDACSGRQWLDCKLDVAVHTAATRLALERIAGAGVLGNALAIGDLRSPDVGIDAVLAQEAVNQNFQVQLAHAGDDGLAGLGVTVHPARRVRVHELP